jgi:hypothetical protein
LHNKNLQKSKKRKSVLQKQYGLKLLLNAESLIESINTSTGVNQLLFAGIERVALRADFNLDVLLGGTGCENVTASATNCGLFVIGMDTFLHVVHLFLVSLKGRNCPSNSLIARISYHRQMQIASVFLEKIQTKCENNQLNHKNYR